jgi:hypothetical protein
MFSSRQRLGLDCIPVGSEHQLRKLLQQCLLARADRIKHEAAWHDVAGGCARMSEFSLARRTKGNRATIVRNVKILYIDIASG